MNIILFSWYGGKIRFVEILEALIPEHKIWVEPYMGSAALTLNHARSQKEVINDWSVGLVCLFQTLQDKEAGRELIEKAWEIECTRQEFEKALIFKNNWDKLHGEIDAKYIDVDRALNEFILITNSFNNMSRKYSSKNEVDIYKYRIRSNIRLSDTRKRLEGVEIRRGNALDVIKEFANNREAFLFLDPPYEHDKRVKGATNVYSKEMYEGEHRELLETIKNAKAKIILCGYRFNDVNKETLYDQYLLPLGWNCYKLADTYKLGSAKTTVKKTKASEFVWVNYELPVYARKFISFRKYGVEEESHG